MPSSYLFILIVAAGGAMWFIAQSIEKRRNLGKVLTLEAKLKLADTKSLNLERQVASLKNEATVLKKNLEETQAAKENALTQWQTSVRRGLYMAALCLAGGLLGGAATGWMGAKFTSQAHESRETFEREMNERIALLKAEIFEKELTVLKGNYQVLEKNANELAVEKAVAEAKLAILLENIVIEKNGQGFLLDYKKMKKDWQSSQSQVILNNREIANPIGT